MARLYVSFTAHGEVDAKCSGFVTVPGDHVGERLNESQFNEVLRFLLEDVRRQSPKVTYRGISVDYVYHLRDA